MRRLLVECVKCEEMSAILPSKVFIIQAIHTVSLRVFEAEKAREINLYAILIIVLFEKTIFL